jgi:hypothetical protein
MKLPCTSFLVLAFLILGRLYWQLLYYDAQTIPICGSQKSAVKFQTNNVYEINF